MDRKTEASLVRKIISRWISNNNSYKELGDVILDTNLGRKTKDDITICDLTGTGVQDTAIARYAYQIANKLNLGTHLE